MAKKNNQTADKSPDVKVEKDFIDNSEEELEQPVVTNWADDAHDPHEVEVHDEFRQSRNNSRRPTREQVLECTDEKLKELGETKLSNVDLMDVLRWLMRTGYDQGNPPLGRGCQDLLLQLNCVSTRPKRRQKWNRGGFRGGFRGRRRGNFRHWLLIAGAGLHERVRLPRYSRPRIARGNGS